MPHIRLATEHDIDSLIALYIEFHEFHAAGVPDRLRRPDAYDEASLRDSLRSLMSGADMVIFVVDAGDTLLGLAEVYLRQDEPHPLRVPHRYGHLQSLFVIASQRRAGWGRRLVEAARQWTKQRGATEMQLEMWEFPAGPLQFYERLGYRTMKRHLVSDLSGRDSAGGSSA